LGLSVIAKYGSYEAYLYLEGMDSDALEAMGIPVGQGSLPAKDAPLQLLYGNQCLMDFSNSRTGENYWETGVLPDIDLMNDSIFYIFDTDAYWDAQYNDGSEGDPVKPPKKYMVDTCGVIAGDQNDYNSYSWNVYCDIDALKLQLKKVFKNKPIPGQPTTASGKPYKELFYNSIYVNVDEMDNVKEVQSAITEMGYQAESNMEWVESNQRQYGYVQAVLGGIGAVSMLVAAISIANTMMMSIYERTKEIGVMKVLGCDIRNIQAMFLMEAGMIGLIGGIAGLGLSYGISTIINIVVKSLGTDMQLSYIPIWLAGLSIIFAVLVGVGAGFFPSRRAMNLSPLAAIRNE
ncbi:MAG: FtsX-like permease family protein, partial [Lachnospiraceae bacterium]|nr:FtsX-like permease family protein [Lachnospiraceae bacterium]